jgi:hypothetical protein
MAGITEDPQQGQVDPQTGRKPTGPHKWSRAGSPPTRDAQGSGIGGIFPTGTDPGVIGRIIGGWPLTVVEALRERGVPMQTVDPVTNEPVWGPGSEQTPGPPITSGGRGVVRDLEGRAITSGRPSRLSRPPQDLSPGQGQFLSSLEDTRPVRQRSLLSFLEDAPPGPVLSEPPKLGWRTKEERARQQEGFSPPGWRTNWPKKPAPIAGFGRLY